MVSKYLLDVTQFSQYEKLKESFQAVKHDLSLLSQPELIAKSFDIYNHYRHNPKSGIDPSKITKPVSWNGVFLYHTSLGWTPESDNWPALKQHLLGVQGIASIQVNFIAPHSIVPMHKDLSNGEPCTTTILAIQVSSENKFVLEDVTITLKEQDLIAIDGVNVFHEVQNLSDTWRITLVIDLANNHKTLV
jgi:hypothetical protein